MRRLALAAPRIPPSLLFSLLHLSPHSFLRSLPFPRPSLFSLSLSFPAEALNTRDSKVMVRTLRVLQAMLDLGDGIGRALVPYYRQLLPIMNVFAGRTVSIGDKIDYHQRFGHLGELIMETIQKMEIKGGPDAFINIKYIIATYESAVLG